jgi:hypothetical protein
VENRLRSIRQRDYLAVIAQTRDKGRCHDALLTSGGGSVLCHRAIC